VWKGSGHRRRQPALAAAYPTPGPPRPSRNPEGGRNLVIGLTDRTCLPGQE